MDNAVKALIEKLSVKFIVIVILTVLVWYGLLTGVALFTSRTVDFFPPRIGSDTALQARIQELSQRALEIVQTEQAHRARLVEAVNQARANSLSAQAVMAVGMTEARLNVVKAENELREEDEKFLRKIEGLRSDMRSLSEKF